MAKKKTRQQKRLEILEKLKAYQREHLEKLSNRKPGTYGPN